MRYSFYSIIMIGAMALTAAYCTDRGAVSGHSSSTSAGAAGEENTGNAAFSCKLNGAPIINTEDQGLYNPMLDRITVTGENGQYLAGIKIPTDLQAGQTCSTCTGFVQEKIKHEGMPEERKIYEWVKDITVRITARRGNHLEGTFSFTVKVKEEGEKQMVVTDGYFKTDLQ